jgi:hypothetical protein
MKEGMKEGMASLNYLRHLKLISQLSQNIKLVLIGQAKHRVTGLRRKHGKRLLQFIFF